MSYLEEVLGIKAIYSQWKDSKKLPFLITDRYDFQRVFLDEVPTVFMYVKGSMESLANTKAHVRKAGSLAGVPLVLVLQTCLPRQRESLIRAGIPFIVEGTQIFLPFMGIALREKYSRPAEFRTQLTPSAQVVFLHLLYGAKNKILLRDVAKELNLTAMTASRAVRQLEDAGMLKTQKEGVHKIILMTNQGQALFRKAESFLLSPVGRKLYVTKDKAFENCLKAGYLALSECSMLSAPRTNVYAVNNLPAEYMEEMTDADQDTQIEQWIYDPCLFEKNGSVDPISLYLSLRDDPDERVQEALDTMMSDFWREYHA
ncbi:transcriptional regulator, MarR family [Oribacterium sp. oral taxon 078 str. F0263]|uniref:MarR family transcriptional regulator n=1 Tax=Oribacterium sp. oral taxon 078 TaxID=652706 RepID=UPI0003AE133E|nr:MarR family transcriptional regulator [Oribacterium sp. oral taxon 078]ERL20541.1 transcriptional regulator, MarR family [Oribacterium sp. oral taxon 078 str. F0263]